MDCRAESLSRRVVVVEKLWKHGTGTVNIDDVSSEFISMKQREKKIEEILCKLCGSGPFRDRICKANATVLLLVSG